MSFVLPGNLPVFETVLSSPFDLAAAASSGAAFLRRAIRLGRTPDTVTCLGGLLELGEEHFAALARAGLPVVDHTWGLTPVEAVPPHRQHEFVDYAGRCLPQGQFLAAETAVIQPHRLPANRSQTLVPLTAASQYRRSDVVGHTGVSLVEMDCVYGTPVSPDDLDTISQHPQYWMHNVDLYFRET